MMAEYVFDWEPFINPRADRILAAVAYSYGVTVDDIHDPGRDPVVVTARHVAAYLLRTLEGMSLPDICGVIGWSTGEQGTRSGGTAAYAIRQLTLRQRLEPELARQVEFLADRLSRPEHAGHVIGQLRLAKEAS